MLSFPCAKSKKKCMELKTEENYSELSLSLFYQINRLFLKQYILFQSWSNIIDLNIFDLARYHSKWNSHFKFKASTICLTIVGTSAIAPKPVKENRNISIIIFFKNSTVIKDKFCHRYTITHHHKPRSICIILSYLEERAV